MAIIRWKPLPVSSPSSFSRWMDDLFTVESEMRPTEEVALPAANVLEKDGKFELQLAAPGLEKEDFNVDLDNGILTISAERKEEEEREEENYTRREFSYRSLRRQFTLPENIEEKDIEAKYENGVLKIQIPKKEMEVKKKPRQISIS